MCRRWPKLGMPNFDATGWIAMVGPAGLPADIVNKVNKVANDFIASKEGGRRWTSSAWCRQGERRNSCVNSWRPSLSNGRPSAEKVKPE